MGGFDWGKDLKLEETQDTLVLLTALRRLWAMLPQGNTLPGERDLI